MLDRSITGQSGETKPTELKPSLNIRTWCCAPLIAAGEFVGFMTLSERVNGVPFSNEDFDLIKTIADQAAASLLNLKLSERLQTAKQLETFQMVSAFFVHDLKNLAGALSLTLQNLPVHFDNPEFRKDTLKMISQSVDKINTLCSRLSNLSQKLELHKNEVDLNELITNALTHLSGGVKGSLVQNLRPVPKVLMDAEQIQRVLTNLILNAGEASDHKGTIRIESDHRNGWVEFSVKDDGCGISEDFLEESLFRPFKTTKKKGLGIGLFQCKRIVDAHEGKIEVESKPGKGSTFRVMLPKK